MSDASEKVMRFLYQGKDNIAWRLVRVLVGLALEKDTLTLHGASGDVNLENLLLLCCSLALALLASILLLKDLAGT
jgi:hypothetical protein